MPKPGVNEFYDINKLPSEPGIFYFALSMPLLNSVQHPKEMYKADMDLIKKIKVSNTGVNVVYTDNLYFYSKDNPMDLKLKHQKMVETHKQSWMKIIKKDIYLIPSAFNFLTWNQLILDCENFSAYLAKFYRIYEKDKLLKKYIKNDIERTGRKVSKYTVGYILEEILLDYLVTKGVVKLKNDYTKGQHKWILNAYQGKPHSSHVYLHQKNFFKIDNKENIFQDSWYDILEKKLYDFKRLDIETFNFKDKKEKDLSY